MNCFTAFHFCGALSMSHITLVEVVLKSESCPKPIADLKLPQDKAIGDKVLPKVRSKRK